jgi:hypothetical protein
METQWIRDRALLRSLMSQYPHWSNPQYAQATGRSVSWVKKWKHRLKQACTGYFKYPFYKRASLQVLLVAFLIFYTSSRRRWYSPTQWWINQSSLILA